MTRNKIGVALAQIALVTCLLAPGLVLAADASTTSSTTTSGDGSATGQFVPLTHFPQIQNLAESNGFAGFVNTLYKICIGAGAVLAVIMIMVAGVEFMTSRGSVTSNEKAKAHISNALLGLLLVLAPTIVFGIINPDILNLNLGNEFTQLKQEKGINQNAFDSPPSVGGTSQLPTNCADYTDKQAKPLLETCTAPAVKVAASCCSTTDSAGICCARPKTSAATAATQYEWKVTVTSSTGGGLGGLYGVGSNPQSTDRSGGPFDTQQACVADYAAFQASGVQGTVKCDCSKPRSEFAACSQ